MRIISLRAWLYRAAASLAWALMAVVVGTITWGSANVILDPPLEVHPPTAVMIAYVARFYFACYFGGFIAILALPGLWLLLLLWRTAAEHWPQLEASRIRRLVASLGLSLPFTITVFWFYLDAYGALDGSWGDAPHPGSVLLTVLISAWVGVLLPVRMFGSLRRQRDERAA